MFKPLPGILALDQATTLGWSHALPGQEPAWGTKKFDGTRGAGYVGASLWRFLEAQIGCYEPAWIVREDLSFMLADSFRAKVKTNAETIDRLIGMSFEIDAFAELYGIECRKISSATAAKHMTGRGRFADARSKKLAVLQACRARGWGVKQDEADALSLLLFAESILYPEAAYRRPRVLKPIEGPLFT